MLEVGLMFEFGADDGGGDRVRVGGGVRDGAGVGGGMLVLGAVMDVEPLM